MPIIGFLNFHKIKKLKVLLLRINLKINLVTELIQLTKVGVYVPGGKASYPSSVLMNCIPAIVAGVPEIFMTVPCLNKKISPAILYAAKKCKVKKFINLEDRKL